MSDNQRTAEELYKDLNSLADVILSLPLEADFSIATIALSYAYYKKNDGNGTRRIMQKAKGQLEAGIAAYEEITGRSGYGCHLGLEIPGLKEAETKTEKELRQLTNVYNGLVKNYNEELGLTLEPISDVDDN